MNPKQFNGIYRPLVKTAWLDYCRRRGTAPNNKNAYDLWYQSTLLEFSAGKLHSTKDATAKQQQFLIDKFKTMIGRQDTLDILGWSDAQISRFKDLAASAWNTAKIDGQTTDFLPWIHSIIARHGHRRNPNGCWAMSDRKESFDLLMADLAIIANDEYWITRTAAAAEIRMRWQISQFLLDLDFLDKRFIHTWDYVRGIYKQSNQLPSDINECPSQTLWRVMQMLDTHIRRICKDFDVRPADLPTRAHPHQHLSINETAHHLHVGHSLEHCQPVEIHAEELDPIPF